MFRAAAKQSTDSPPLTQKLEILRVTLVSSTPWFLVSFYSKGSQLYLASQTRHELHWTRPSTSILNQKTLKRNGYGSRRFGSKTSGLLILPCLGPTCQWVRIWEWVLATELGMKRALRMLKMPPPLRMTLLLPKLLLLLLLLTCPTPQTLNPYQLAAAQNAPSNKIRSSGRGGPAHEAKGLVKKPPGKTTRPEKRPKLSGPEPPLSAPVLPPQPHGLNAPSLEGAQLLIQGQGAMA